MILLIAIRLYVAQITNVHVVLFTGKECATRIQYKENKCVLDKK